MWGPIDSLKAGDLSTADAFLSTEKKWSAIPLLFKTVTESLLEIGDTQEKYMAKFENNIVLVSGSTRGIGLAIAKAFLAEGARVVISSRKPESVLSVVETLKSDYGEKVMGTVCHVGKVDTHAAVFEQINAEWGPVDILINNAAANPFFGPMMNIEWSAFDKTFEVNIRGALSLSRTFARQLPKDSTGSIVNVSSIFGLGAAPLQGTYGMTKAALVSMTQTLAHEWAPMGIRVNVIAPGLVDTHFAQALTSNETLVKHYTDRAALRRYGQPDEIAGAVVYLASDAAGFVTGQLLTIDGGYRCG